MAKGKKRIAKSKTELLIESAHRQAKQFYASGQYDKALKACLQATRLAPWVGDAWLDAAINAIRLEQWQDAIDYALKAEQCGTRKFTLYDTLSHAYGALKQWDKAGKAGLRALQMRDEQFGLSLFDRDFEFPTKLPAKPTVRNVSKNIIAFSLFGRSSKYCETAILNAMEQPRIYPNWRCRFYIDDSVSLLVAQRLRDLGSEVIIVDEETKKLPGPMWRFLAADDKSIYRVIFRDADSVISEREMKAVNEWVKSGKLFHIMRDIGTHTELMLAGLWGMVAGALPPMISLIEHFMKQPMKSKHFADQFFLREMVWPYAKQSLLQHDSLFGFLDSEPFPDGAIPHNFHIGYAEGSVYFTHQSDLSDGTEVIWLFIDNQAEKVLFYYTTTVKDGKVVDFIPRRYAEQLEAGTAHIRIKKKE